MRFVTLADSLTLLVCVWYDHRTPHVNPWHIFNIPRPFTAILFTSVGVLDAIMKIHLNACIRSKRFKVEEEPLLLFNGGNFIVVAYFELAYLVHHFKSDMIQGGILQLILCSDTDIVKSGLKSIYSTIEMTHNDFFKVSTHCWKANAVSEISAVEFVIYYYSPQINFRSIRDIYKRQLLNCSCKSYT